MINKSSILNFCALALLLSSFVVAGCNKTTELAAGPYFKAPNPSVQFYGKTPLPAAGKVGDKITYEVKGLDKLKDYTFYINQVKAEIVSAKDSAITVVIPEGTSSGPASILTADGQYYYGPVLKIDGRVSIDRSFKTGIGTNGPIYSVYYNGAGNGLYLLGGNFTDYNNQSAAGKVNSIVKISSDGTFLDYSAGKGSLGGTISSILPVSGQFYLGGIMSSYGDYAIEGVTRVNDDCSIDSTTVLLVNPDEEHFPDNSIDTVPSLNAYLSGWVAKLFTGTDDQIIAIGNFALYSSYFYERSQKGIYYIDRTRMENFVRFDSDGKLDSSFNFDPITGMSKKNLNGFISDGIQLPNGQIIFVGSFTSFNGSSAPKIAALTEDGGQDPVFAGVVGSGADGDITRITYNETTGKIMITGAFTHYNGHVAKGVAMLNQDGSFDESFSLKAFEGGAANYAGQLNNGKVIISGDFNKYAGVVRQGFMILNADGTLAAGYNNTGAFSGGISGIIEPNNNSVVLYGLISLFDNVKVGNIVKIAFD